MKAGGCLNSVANERIVITGFLSTRRDDVIEKIRSAGGSYQEDVAATTTILVQGRPHPQYAFKGKSGDLYGVKLDAVDQARSRGQRIAIVTEAELDALLRGPGLTLKETQAAFQGRTSRVGVPHRYGRLSPRRASFLVRYDPSDMDRATQRHHRVVDKLARAVESAGFVPLDPTDQVAAFDLAC